MADIRNRLRQWWQERSGAAGDPQLNASQDLLHLFRLRREHRLLRLRFAGIAQEYQSLLLDVDLRGHRLLLDEPFPTLAEAELFEGRKLEVASIEGAASTRFGTRIQGLVAQGDLNALAVAIPVSVAAFQRRNHFRLSVPDRMPVQAILRHDTLGNLSARVLDLSSSGIRILVPSLALQSPLQTAPLLLKLPHDRGMLCTLKVCSQQHSPDQENTVLGGELVGLNPPQVQLVERFIARGQRLQRQQEMALEH